MKYNELSLGQIEAVVNKLGGMDGVQRLLAGETKPTITGETFVGIRKVRVGNYTDIDSLKEALKNAGVTFYNSSSRFLEDPRFRLCDNPQEINAIVLSVRELGFDRAVDPCSFSFRERIKELSFLSYGPDELGVQIRLQYPKQPKGTELVVAKESTFSDHLTSPGWFTVVNIDGNPGLCSHSVRGALGLDDKLVFQLK